MTLQSILAPLKRSVFLPIKNYILTLPFLAKLLLVLFFVAIIPLTYFLVKKIRKNKDLEKTEKTIKDTNKLGSIKSTKKDDKSILLLKDIKKLTSKYKFTNRICDLHILPMLSEFKSVYHLYDNMEFVQLSDGIAIAINSSNFLLLVLDSHLDDILTIKSKLKIEYSENINIHFNLDRNYYEELIILRNKLLTLAKIKNIIISFYSQADNIDEFNNLIGKDNIFELSDSLESITDIIELISSKILLCNESNDFKHLSNLMVKNIHSILEYTYQIIQDKGCSLFVFTTLNKKNNFYTSLISEIKNKHTSLNKKNLAITLISISASIIFLLNIVNILDEKERMDNEKINSQNIDYLKTEIDKNIILSSIYPNSLKYKYLYVKYADLILNEKLIPILNKTKSLSELTTILVYIHFLDKGNSEGLSKVIPILAKYDDLSEFDLKLIKDYADRQTISNLVETAEQAASIFYSNTSNDNIINYKLQSESFENDYFDLSDLKRANIIYKSLEASIRKCDAENILMGIHIDTRIPASFQTIFKQYKEHTKHIYAICNSQSIEVMSSDIRMINSYLKNIQIKNFEEYINAISNIVNKIEKSRTELKLNSSSYKKFNEYLPILIRYSVSQISASIYKDETLPLVHDYNKDLYINFDLNTYSKPISISPIYSKEYIEDRILPIMNNFQKLKNSLKVNYNIDSNFLYLLYRDSLESYSNNYIKNYLRILNEANKASVNTFDNKDSLRFYLVTMAANDSSFSNFIKYYMKNTSLKFKDFQIISDYFENDDTFLSSEKYNEYINIFLLLKNLIVSKGYKDAYAEIKNGYKPLENAYNSLADTVSNKNDKLYLILKNRLNVAIKSIQLITIDDAVESIDKSINSDYLYLNGFLPFDINSNKILSNKDLISYIGNSGSIYLPYKELIEPLLEHDKTKNVWFNSDFSSPEAKTILKQFNKIYSFHHLLLSDDGGANSIELEVTPIPSDKNNYIFYSFMINETTFVNSLNVNYSEAMKIQYSWSRKDKISITLKLDNGQMLQKSYTGDWALIKALKDSEHKGDIYTWIFSYEDKKYPISFKINSPFINAIGNN